MKRPTIYLSPRTGGIAYENSALKFFGIDRQGRESNRYAILDDLPFCKGERLRKANNIRTITLMNYRYLTEVYLDWGGPSRRLERREDKNVEVTNDMSL